MSDSLKSPNSKAVIGFRQRQCGAILIMVLLIVALVAGLGIKFAGDYQLGLVRAEARWHGAQARAYLYSGEGAAIKLLANDDPQVDYQDEMWGQPVPLELDDGAGKLLLAVTDANAQFNLNLLFGAPLDPAKAITDSTRYTPAQRMFIRLLQVLPNPEAANEPLLQSPEQAAGILEAVMDWVDTDKNQSGANGAEDDYYLSQPDPYQAANQPFRSIEELQLIRGMTPAILKALRPYVTVLKQIDSININTMAPLLFRAINISTELAPISESQASSLMQDKPSAGYFSSAEEIKASWEKIAGGTGGSLDKEMLTTKTNYFWLTTSVQIGDQRRFARSLLQRGNPQFKVVRREDVYDGINQ